MPQPLSRVRATAKFDFDPGSLDDKPELATLVASIFAMASDIDVEFGLLLVRILGADAAPAIAMYSVLTGQPWQRKALEAAAEAALKPQDRLDVFKAVINVCDSAQKPRNKLAHWVWAKSAELPNCLLLADPIAIKESQITRVKFLEAISRGSVTGIKRSWEIDPSQVLVYTKPDLDRMRRDLFEATQMLAHFRDYLSPVQTLRDVHDLAAESLRQLSNLRLFREALARVKVSRQNNPQSQP